MTTTDTSETSHAGEAASGESGDIVISIDAMGGDRGVADVVRGMGKSLEKNPRLRYIVHGDGDALEAAIRRQSPLAARTEIRHASSVIGMDAKPSRALRAAKGSSMWNALQSVRDGESPAVISCGNTGALMALSMLALRKAPGVDRPAIAVLWPSRNPSGYNVVLDAGADIRADAKDLLKFALMGTSYARNALGIHTPRIGLLNVGTEEHKGRSELHEAAELMAAASTTGEFEYIGYVEGNDMPSDRVDVIVTDGFAGNVALKAAEGTARMIGDLLRDAFNYSLLSRVGGLFALTSLRRFQKRIDPRRVNGGVFLGLNGTVIKSHGSADATGVSAAIKLAFTLSESGFNRRLVARVAAGAQHSGADPSGKAIPEGGLS
ncbi:phosphate acyltransferase PlsX [Amaricoccus macauensis]|uniref:phosphate acyltransferase PlsX n=1 Tax=Amaricoccus macauensis TaxID=57001 RepID=UPI003C7E0271